eukprot:Phypoly_transcript_02021.p1 GENE.Phypoly_transcript_02021~~Phypoly_transcript_02021.p1  ORF type:complete len:983 (+),score=101.44 Phypoly_transcript_02021:356-2950(+)
MTYDYREIAFEELKLDDTPIGSGAFGVVHKGIWRGATVAVKKLLVVMDEDLLTQEVRREATVIQGVAHHPNIVRFYGACTKKQPYCLVTSLYPRGSVFNIIRKIDLEWRTIVGFARDAAAGILHLHCESVIHRDIATRNLLVDDQWTVRISDFGLARIKVKATSQTKSSVGPVKWMAPEALKEKQYSTKSDVYSFGILMWELVARKDPFEDMEAIQVALGVLHDGLRPPIPDTTPKKYAELMQKCWAQDPDKRPDFHEILDTLQTYYNGLPQVQDPATASTALASSVVSSPLISSGINPRQSALQTYQELECPICGEIYDNVMETPCCHACYCRRCIRDWIAKSNTCPECRANIQENQLKPNVPVQRFVDNMPAECPNAVSGCTDRITRGIANEHLTKCGYALVECDGYKQFMDSLAASNTDNNINNNTSPNSYQYSGGLALSSNSSSSSSSNRNSIPQNQNHSNRNSLNMDSLSPSSTPPSSPPIRPPTLSVLDWSENSIKLAKPCGKILRKDLANHKANLCPFRVVDCEFECGAKIRFFQVEDHLRICPNVEIMCPNECGLRTKRGLMQHHRDTDCELQVISCKYHSWGCATERARKNMWEHYENASQAHLALAESFISEKQAKIVHLKESREDLFRHCAKAKEENVHLRLTIEGLSALKPHLPHHPLNSEPLILPSALVMPEHPEAQSLIVIESDFRTAVYQQPTKFFASKLSNTKAIVVRSDRMIPNSNIVYYFEASLKSLGKDGAIGIGLVNAGHEVFAMPGWHVHTYGYHGDDGRKFGAPNHQFGNIYGPVWQKDDVVGCGWDQVQHKIFFTLNGKFLGNAFENVTGNYFVAIGLHTHGARVKMNFGQEPFMFDIQNR